MKTSIYVLLDPITELPRYVGKSDNPQKRFGSHLLEKGFTRKIRWIKKLQKIGLQPTLVVLEYVDEDKWEIAERRWIRLFKMVGVDLTNLTDGGDGLKNPSEETRKKIGDARKRDWENNREEKLKIARGSTRREKISNALRGKKKSAAHVAKLPQNQKGRKCSLEHRRKISEGMLGKKRPNSKVSPENREKMTAGLQKKLASMSPEERRVRNKRQSEKILGKSRSQEAKDKIAKAMKATWAKRDKKNFFKKKQANFKWPDISVIDEMMKSLTTKEVAEKLGVTPCSLYGFLFRQRKKNDKSSSPPED